MSEFYKLEFEPADAMYAEIKEKLKTYFDSGAIDDLMFPIWTKRCIDKFRRSLYRIENTTLHVDSYEAPLPDDFKFVREAWLCTNVQQYIQMPHAFYYQKDCRVSAITDSCEPCFTADNSPVPIIPCTNSTCDPCKDNYVVTHKRTNHAVLSYNFSHLLRPGNILTQSHCAQDCGNMSSRSKDIFDIRDCKLVTNFESGIVHLTYYTDVYDIDNNILIPENVRIQEYIRNYLMYQIFETLSHQTTDESLRTIENKMMYYKQLSEEAYVVADIELKKQTSENIMHKIRKSHQRYRGYNIR